MLVYHAYHNGCLFMQGAPNWIKPQNDNVINVKPTLTLMRSLSLFLKYNNNNEYYFALTLIVDLKLKVSPAFIFSSYFHSHLSWSGDMICCWTSFWLLMHEDLVRFRITSFRSLFSSLIWERRSLIQLLFSRILIGFSVIILLIVPCSSLWKEMMRRLRVEAENYIENKQESL